MTNKKLIAVIKLYDDQSSSILEGEWLDTIMGGYEDSISSYIEDVDDHKIGVILEEISIKRPNTYWQIYSTIIRRE